jgi:hypothetical protein
MVVTMVSILERLTGGKKEAPFEVRTIEGTRGLERPRLAAEARIAREEEKQPKPDRIRGLFRPREPVSPEAAARIQAIREEARVAKETRKAKLEQAKIALEIERAKVPRGPGFLERLIERKLAPRAPGIEERKLALREARLRADVARRARAAPAAAGLFPPERERFTVSAPGEAIRREPSDGFLRSLIFAPPTEERGPTAAALFAREEPTGLSGLRSAFGTPSQVAPAPAFQPRAVTPSPVAPTPIDTGLSRVGRELRGG